MKNLNLFLNESLNSSDVKRAMDVIRQFTSDYVETDGTYTDKELQQIINGEIEPEYDEICDYIYDVWSASDNKPDEVIDVLDDKDEYIDDIHVAILRGFQDYIETK